MRKALQIPVILLTFLFSFLLVVYWAPSQIAQKSQALLAATHVPQAPTVEVLSQELLTYIEQEQQNDNHAENEAFERELLEKLEAFQNNYLKSNDAYLADRFAIFDGNLGQSALTIDVPEGLEDVVQFWVRIFGVYDKNQVIFYNQNDVGVVYGVLDFAALDVGSEDGTENIRANVLSEETARLREVLENVADAFERKKPLEDLNDEEVRIYKQLALRRDSLSLNKRDLLGSFVYRYGFAHRMKQAMSTSTRYMPHIQKVLSERGLPEVLCAIPFVESAFNLKAYSKAGAAGIWQFIESTGRNYLKIDDYVDERYDPVLATYAAAAHLAREYEMLGSWPLTINAYNAGPGRLMQAVQQLGTTDIATIIKNFKGSGYGFDSRNYFPEVLAAYEVYKNRETYFGKTFASVGGEPAGDYLPMAVDTNVRDLMEAAGLQAETIMALNPAIKPEVFYGEKDLPKGYLLKVPPQQKQDVILAAQQLYVERQYADYHIVEKGEDLAEIARKYDVQVADLRDANGLIKGQRVKAGDILKLPQTGGEGAYTFIKNAQPNLVDEVMEQKIREIEQEQGDSESTDE